MLRSFLLSVAAASTLVACGRDNAAPAADSAATAAGTPMLTPANQAQPAGPLTLTAADIDGFEKGIRREVELVKAAKDRASKATDPQVRGEAIQSAFEQNTMAQAAPVTGLSAERYALVRQTLNELLQTLDFQGKIDGPMSLDTARASPESKARLSSDAYAAVDPAGAAALKSRLSRIVPIWSEYITLIVTGG